MHRKFFSLAQPEMYGYAYDTTSYDYQAQVNGHFRMFQTYGDGLTQHSGDWSITREYMADYLASIVAFIIAQPGQLTGQTENGYDENLLNRLQSEMTNGVPCKEALDFCAGVIFKESDREWSKRRYFSVSERKVSGSRSKEHDKRYEEIKEWQDGSPKAMYRMLTREYASDLERYALADAIRDWLHAQSDYSKSSFYMGLTAEFLEWFTDAASSKRDAAQQLRHAYGAARAICEAYRLQCVAAGELENYKRGLPKKEVAPVTESTEISA